MHPGPEYDVQRLPCGIGTDLIRVDTNPGIDGHAVALHRRLALPYGCVISGENVSRRTVSCWVRFPRHLIFPNAIRKGKTRREGHFARSTW
jgi:hypothetical protein